MNPIYQRLAELWIIKQSRLLEESEMDEFIMIMQANVNMAWEYVRLKNMRCAADITNDIEWKEEIASEIEQIREMNLLY